MNAIRQSIASAAEAYLKAEKKGDVKELIAASGHLYEALGQPLGKGLSWIWLEFGTWTTTN